MGLRKEIRFLNREISRIDKNIKDNIDGFEDWMIERRKFFIKLLWTLGLIALLLAFSHWFLRIYGSGLG